MVLIYRNIEKKTALMSDKMISQTIHMQITGISALPYWIYVTLSTRLLHIYNPLKPPALWLCAI